MSTGRRVERLEGELSHADPGVSPAVAYLHPLDWIAARHLSDEAARAVLDHYNVELGDAHFCFVDEGHPGPEDVPLHNTFAVQVEPRWVKEGSLRAHAVEDAPVVAGMELSEADAAALVHAVEEVQRAAR